MAVVVTETEMICMELELTRWLAGWRVARLAVRFGEWLLGCLVVRLYGWHDSKIH